MRGRRRSRAPRFGGSGRKPQCSYCHYTPLNLFVNTQHTHGGLKPPPTTPDASTAPKPHATSPGHNCHPCTTNHTPSRHTIRPRTRKKKPQPHLQRHTQPPEKKPKKRGRSTRFPPIPWP